MVRFTGSDDCIPREGFRVNLDPKEPTFVGLLIMTSLLKSFGVKVVKGMESYDAFSSNTRCHQRRHPGSEV